MNSPEANAARTESARRQRQSVRAGSAPWPWPVVLILAGAFVAIGLIIDLDIVWPLAVVTSGACAIVITESRRTPSSYNWAALAATFFLGLLAGIAVQFVGRAADLPLPHTWGAAAAALIIIGVSRPVEARMAASPRP
jgi:uncharacterized membrane protein